MKVTITTNHQIAISFWWSGDFTIGKDGSPFFSGQAETLSIAKELEATLPSLFTFNFYSEQGKHMVIFKVKEGITITIK